MAYGRVDLANATLGLLGRDRIRDPDGDEPGAVQTKLHMDAAVGEVIEEFDWPQCRVVQDLVAVEDVPLRGWAYAYAIPADAVVVWRISNLLETDTTKFEKFEIGMSADLGSDTNYIFTSTSALSIRYGSARAALARFSPQTRELMAIKLAFKLVMVLPKDPKLLNFYDNRYTKQLSAIKTRMANLEPEEYAVDDVPELVLARWG